MPLHSNVLPPQISATRFIPAAPLFSNQKSLLTNTMLQFSHNGYVFARVIQESSCCASRRKFYIAREGPRCNFEIWRGGGGEGKLETRYFGGSRHFFLLTFFNFKNTGGGHVSPAPLFRARSLQDNSVKLKNIRQNSCKDSSDEGQKQQALYASCLHCRCVYILNFGA